MHNLDLANELNPDNSRTHNHKKAEPLIENAAFAAQAKAQGVMLRSRTIGHRSTPKPILKNPRGHGRLFFTRLIPPQV